MIRTTSYFIDKINKNTRVKLSLFSVPSNQKIEEK